MRNKRLDKAETPPSPVADGTTTESTVDLTQDEPTAQPKLPHENDEAVGMTDGLPTHKTEQAHRDVERGVKDTSRGAEADRSYEKLRKD